MTTDGHETRSAPEGFGMPHAIAFAVLGAGLYAGLKLASDQLQRLAAKASARAEANARADTAGVAAARDAGTLVWDEAANAYRVKR